jgi:hypothetical protein
LFWYNEITLKRICEADISALDYGQSEWAIQSQVFVALIVFLSPCSRLKQEVIVKIPLQFGRYLWATLWKVAHI